MRNIKLVIQYDGTNYSGWQTQKLKEQSEKCKVTTIQETIEQVLQKILQEKINLISSGRTDSGVHAIAQVANFKTNSKISPFRIKGALNGLLPEDIKIIDVKEVSLNFHSRFDAKSKIYRYLILNSKVSHPLLERFIYFYPLKLDFALMKKASKKFLGRHNFKVFCASGSSAQDTTRLIKKIVIKKPCFKFFGNLPGLISVEIEGDGFLYNMVRSIVGTLVSVAENKIEIDALDRIIRENRRALIGATLPAKGLCLIKVKY